MYSITQRVYEEEGIVIRGATTISSGFRWGNNIWAHKWTSFLNQITTQPGTIGLVHDSFDFTIFCQIIASSARARPTRGQLSGSNLETFESRVPVAQT